MKNKFKPMLSRIEELRILNLVNISLQSKICVNMSWNCWHISNCYCRCPTDTESIWTQFFKVQISLKLFGNTFYSTKYTSFSVRAYWPGLPISCPVICLEPILKPNRSSSVIKCIKSQQCIYFKRGHLQFTVLSQYL